MAIEALVGVCQMAILGEMPAFRCGCVYQDPPKLEQFILSPQYRPLKEKHHSTWPEDKDIEYELLTDHAGANIDLASVVGGHILPIPRERLLISI